MLERNTYLFVGGGTAGHVNPAIAVVQACEKLASAEYVFLVNQGGIEEVLVPKAGYRTEQIKAAPLASINPITWFRFLHRNLVGYLRARKVIKRLRPRAVLATGGYVGSPVLLACKHLKIPFVLHEQNAYPGRSNRLFAKDAECVCLSFDESRKYLNKQSKFYLTGNPVKSQFFTVDSREARRELKISDDTFIVLLLGGSLGAQSINQAVIDLLKMPEWQSYTKEHKIQIVLATGKKSFADVSEQFSAAQGVVVEAYLDTTQWLPACDCFIGRAGASSCVELCAVGKPGLLIPYPHAANNHQYFNAKVLADQGACEICKDEDLTGEILFDFITTMHGQPERAHVMSQSAKKLADPEAAEKIAGVLLKL